MSAEKTVHYVLGHEPHELARLERQAAIFEAPTRALLQRCGIRPGHRVLDLGCGAGDVTLLVSDFVGPAGEVIGVDRAAEAVTTARGRAASDGRRNVTFVQATIDDLAIEPVDAVVGRFVLMHQPAPVDVLRHAARLVRPGGIVAMMESHLDALVLEWHSSPPSAAYTNLLDVMLRTIRVAGGRTDMGLRLRGTFLEAGLPDPAIDVHGTLAGRDAPRLCRYMADSLRSMAAMAERLGVETLPAARIDEMERGMLDDAERPGAVMNGPLVVSAWCRLAGEGVDPDGTTFVPQGSDPGGTKAVPRHGLVIRHAATNTDIAAARELIVAYQTALGIDLSFQDFAHEVATLPGGYAPPDGVLLLAVVDGRAVGCVGVRRFDAERCEMKRLYVAPAARGTGAGRTLAEQAMAHARALGYTRMLLDTLPSMHQAQALYERLGFRDVPAYRVNPVAGTRYLEARL